MFSPACVRQCGVLLHDIGSGTPIAFASGAARMQGCRPLSLRPLRVAAPRRYPQTCVFVSKCLQIPHRMLCCPHSRSVPPVSWAASPTTWLSTFKDSCYVSWLKGDPGCLESAEESAHPHCLWTCFAVRLSSLRAFYVGLASRVGILNPPHVKWMTVQSPGRPSCVSLRWLWWQWPGPVWRSC